MSGSMETGYIMAAATTGIMAIGPTPEKVATGKPVTGTIQDEAITGTVATGARESLIHI